MVELHEVVTVVNWIFWFVMFCVSVVVLVQLSNYFTGESPQTVFKAVRTTFFLWATVYFTYDIAGYLFALLMQDPVNGVRMPAHYTYWDWLREPFALKWHVLSFVPIIRFLPILFGLCAGSILFVFLLDVPYHVALVVFLAQLVVNGVALVVLSFVFNFGIGLYVRDVVQPELVQEREEEIRRIVESREAPASLRHLQHRVNNVAPDQGSVWRRIEASWRSINANLDPLYAKLRPVTKHLPLPAQDFLDSGGWLVFIPVLAVLAFSWPRIHRGRTKLHHRRRKRRAAAAGAVLHLSEIGELLTGLGERQITVQGHPGRLRLIAVAPALPTVGPLPEGAHGALLDSAVAGLSQVAAIDFPKVLGWTDSQACGRFAATLLERVKFPDSAPESSRWLLLSGALAAPQGRYHLAIGVLGERPAVARVLEVPEGRWSDFVGIRQVPVEDRGL
jgi:hypothetical protein